MASVPDPADFGTVVVFAFGEGVDFFDCVAVADGWPVVCADAMGMRASRLREAVIAISLCIADLLSVSCVSA